MLSLNKSASSPPRKAMRCLSIVLVLVAAAAFTPKTTRGGLGLSTTTKPAALLSTATLQEEAVIVYPPDDKMPPKLALALPIRETQTQTALLDAGDILASLARQPVPVRLTTDDDINTFEARAFAAADHGGVLTLLREGATNYIETWALTHHLDVVGDHSTGRKRASVVTAMERRVAAVSAKLSQGEQLTHGLDKAAEEWLDLVCVSKTSLELKPPFSELARSYMYSGGDGCGTESGRMLISGPASLLYKVQQWMSRRGHLPLYIQQAAACFFAEHSLSQRQFVGMGQPILLGSDSDVRDALCEAKDQRAGVFAEGLVSGFEGVLVVGMHGPDYRVWANKHSLPDAHVIDWSGLGADDFSERDGVVRSRAFQEIFDACRAHGVLGSGDEELLVGALHNLKRGVTDLIEALEISNVVPLGGGVFKVRGNPRACEKLKAWPADLPAAVALRNALAPLMRVDAFLEACKFVPVADSAQIKSRRRRHRRDSLVDLCTGTGGGVGRRRRRRLVRQAGLRAGALPQRGQDGPADGAERPGPRPRLLRPLQHGARLKEGRPENCLRRLLPDHVADDPQGAVGQVGLESGPSEASTRRTQGCTSAGENPS